MRLDPARPAGNYTTVNVATCTQLVPALNAAAGPTEIVLAQGLRCAQTLTLPARSAQQGWAIIRTAGYTHTPGQRMTPSRATAAQLARIDAPSNMVWAVLMARGAGFYRFEGVEISLADQVTLAGAIFMASTMNISREDTTLGPVHLIGTYIHGLPTAQQVRCVIAHAPSMIVEDSWLDYCRKAGQDSQAVIAWNSNGPLRIVNNYLAGCGENIMFGGGDPSIPGAIMQDVEIRGNHVDTPGSWKGTCTKKNLLEFKAARRVYVEGNVFEGSWRDGHNGPALVIKSANQGGGCRWCSTSDVTMVDNIIRKVAVVGTITGTDNPSTNPTDSTTRRITITRTLLEDPVNVAPYNTTAIMQLLSLQGPAHDIELTDSRFVDYAAHPNTAIYFDGSPLPRLTLRNLVFKRGTYGVFGNGEGNPTWNLFGAGGTWQNIAIIGANLSIYPSGTISSAGATFGLDPAALKAKLAGVVVQR